MKEVIRELHLIKKKKKKKRKEKKKEEGFSWFRDPQRWTYLVESKLRLSYISILNSLK